MFFDVISVKKPLLRTILAATIYLVGTTALYWQDFAIRGFWHTLARRVIAATLVFGILVIVNSYLYAKRKEKEQLQ